MTFKPRDIPTGTLKNRMLDKFSTIQHELDSPRSIAGNVLVLKLSFSLETVSSNFVLTWKDHWNCQLKSIITDRSSNIVGRNPVIILIISMPRIWE